MEQTFSKVSESTKEFYYYLGLLSIKFAEVENNMLSIIGTLVTDDIFSINIVIEKNSLGQNIEILKKLISFRDFEQETAKKIIEKISTLRIERNLFIHALWGEPILKDGKVIICCLQAKINSKMVQAGRMWASAKKYEFELSDLLGKIIELDSVINLQKELLDKIEDHNF